MLNQDITPITHAQYIREVKSLLPAAAFKPNPWRLLHLAAHFLILFLCYNFIRVTSNIFLLVISSVVIGHSFMCIAWVAHEISHHAVIKNHRIQYFFEVISWGVLGTPATVWQRAHNHTHHVHANTPQDSDRKMFEDEKTVFTNIYEALLFPNRLISKFNPLVGLTFISYNFTTTISAFLPRNKKLPPTRVKPNYKRAQLTKASLELLFVIAFYYAVFRFVGSWQKFTFAGPVSWFFGSTAAMIYIHTNHYDNPISEVNDPLLLATSVVCPRWVDFIHMKFSYHTEHHLFPNMNSDYYPMLSKILSERYPDRYNRRTFSSVWSSLWNKPVYRDRADVIRKKPLAKDG